MGSGISNKYTNTYGSRSEEHRSGIVKEKANGYKVRPRVLRKSTGDSNINDNVAKMTGRFAPNEYGNFGIQGKNVRVMKSEDPLSESASFYDLLGNGGEIKTIPGKAGTITKLDDGSRITYRVITSTEGSPAVEINVKNVNTFIKNQKIHFERS